MNDKLGLLGAVLVVQLLVVAALVIDDALGSAATAPSLLSFDPDEVVKFNVSTLEDSVHLYKDEHGWHLDDDLPADDAKVGKVLDKLANVSAPWPVATSSDSAERFEVTETNFQRRLVLESTEATLADLMLGTSPGYRRVHVRAEGEDEVYSVDFSNYEVPIDIDQWLDKTLLQASGTISRLALEASWQLANEDEGWLIDGIAADQETASDLIDRFADLRVLGVGEASGELKGTFIVTDASGEHRLQMFHEAEEDDYYVTSDRVPGRFEIATYIAEQMLVESSELLPDVADDDESGADADTDG
ncbi:MAG: DUF4340 domain-containing protein [Gammaproteobacteria bacterium]|nr:DUF4340 domain-containing protein [Gammaproteobacteria bacterium]